MLGFDDLEHLGELASQISGNRAKVANVEQKNIDAKVNALQESLRLLPASFQRGRQPARLSKPSQQRPHLLSATSTPR